MADQARREAALKFGAEAHADDSLGLATTYHWSDRRPKSTLLRDGDTCTKDGEKRIRRKTRWHCEHDRQRPTCKDCGGSEICPHDRQRSTCKEEG